VRRFEYRIDGDYALAHVNRPKYMNLVETTNEYADFLMRKTRKHGIYGPTVERKDLHPHLFDFQKDIVSWALRKGRACVFADTGLGKTLMQLEWARHIPGYRIIVAPLGVTEQTINEAKTLHTAVHRANCTEDIKKPGIYITNYERLDGLDHSFDAVILDESGILKSHDGAYRNMIQARFERTHFKLCCTATPSPNDYMELGTHAEFMGALTRAEMLATYFCHDGGDTSKWRLKGHARGDFWKWVQSWAVVIRHPRDLGYEQDGYDLPELRFINHVIDVDPPEGEMFTGGKVAATEIYQVLKRSAPERVKRVAELISAEPDEPWLIWCHTDEEQDLIEREVPGLVSVRGSQSIEVKTDRLIGFATGKYDRLLTKPKIAGHGMNYQRCARMVFCGVTYSFEQVYQCVRRSWRYGQTRPVDVHMVICNEQESIKSALDAKQQAFEDMGAEMRRYTKEILCPIGA